MPRKVTHYTDPDVEGGQYQYIITRTALGKMEKKRQLDIMRQWFYERYEDPVNSQPYESSEGGYIYINGGPFDAREELETEFYGGPLCQDTKIGIDKSYSPPFHSCVLNAFAHGLWKYTSAGVW